MKKTITFLITFVLAASTCLAEGEGAAGQPQDRFPTQFESLEKDKTTCNIGIVYKETPEGMEVDVSALATGKGAEFRQWDVTDIKLDINGAIIYPSDTSKFYTRKESIFRWPAAVVFAALGVMNEGPGDNRSDLALGIDKAGMAAGLGLITSQAKGELTGLKCKFILDKNMAAEIYEGNIVKIVAENRDRNKKVRFKIEMEMEDQ